MTTTADRIAAIQERLDNIAMSGFTLGIVKQNEGDVDYDNVRWLLRRYEDARERLERLRCAPCRGILSDRPEDHYPDCPWRIAREHLEAE